MQIYIKSFQDSRSQRDTFSKRFLIDPNIYIYIYIYTIILHKLWKRPRERKFRLHPIFHPLFPFSGGNFPFNNLEIKDNYIHIYIYIQAFQIHLVNIRTYFRYNRSHFRGKRKKRRRGRRRKRWKREKRSVYRISIFHPSPRRMIYAGNVLKWKCYRAKPPPRELTKSLTIFDVSRSPDMALRQKHAFVVFPRGFQFNFTRTGHSSRDR